MPLHPCGLTAGVIAPCLHSDGGHYLFMRCCACGDALEEGAIRGLPGKPKDEFEKHLGSGDDNLLSWVITTPIGAGAFQSWRRDSSGGTLSPAGGT